MMGEGAQGADAEPSGFTTGEERRGPRGSEQLTPLSDAW